LATKSGSTRTKSAMKRARQMEKQRLRNRHITSTLKTAIKDVETTIASGDISAAKEKLRLAIKSIDKASSKGVMHRNTASRRVSRLTKQLNRAVSAST